MKITLKNVGVIKDSSLLLEGLTVITGKNSSGKTTIGRVVHSILRANREAENAFEDAKLSFLKNQMNKMVDVLAPRGGYTLSNIRSRLIRNMQNDKMTEQDMLRFFLSRYYRRMDLENLIIFLSAIVEILSKASVEDFLDLYGEVYDYSDIDSHFRERYKNSFEERHQLAIDIGTNALSMISSTSVFSSFLHLRIQDFLNYDFDDQIKPVRNKKAISQIIIEENDQVSVNIKIRNKNDFEFLKESSFMFPYDHSVFIDDPFIIDRIHLGKEIYSRSFFETTIDDNQIHSTDITTNDDDIENMLEKNLNENFFDSIKFQEKYHDVFHKINEIVPGEFHETKDKAYYVSDGSKLSIHNLATGSKLFFLLKLLIINGQISNNTLLILDEPESHLHPEWINKFAEIIALLIKEIGVDVLITTHSPNMLLALGVYAKQKEINDRTHFYLAKQKNGGWASNIESIDDNLSEGYGHLSVPFLEMTYLKQHEDELNVKS